LTLKILGEIGPPTPGAKKKMRICLKIVIALAVSPAVRQGGVSGD
jgi:hypothetical protein